MRVVSFQRQDRTSSVGLWTDRGIVPIDESSITQFIDSFEEQRVELERLARTAPALDIRDVQLLAPVPRPGKILCSAANHGDTAPLLLTLKSPESVVGPGDTVRLPAVDETWHFVPEAELGLVIRGPARNVKAAEWRTAVFGLTCVLDVMARGDSTFGRDYWLAKADTLGPLGPCIVTLDEIPQPTHLRVRSWSNAEPRQDFSTADAPYSIGEIVELATTVMTLHTGDVIACGTSPDGLQPLREGDAIDVEIEPIGRLSVQVAA